MHSKEEIEKAVCKRIAINQVQAVNVRYDPVYDQERCVRATQSEQSQQDATEEHMRSQPPPARPIIRNYAEFIEQGLEKCSFKGSCDSMRHEINRNDPEKIFLFGERGSGIRHDGGAQDFYQLRDYHLDNGTLFEDPQFPCEDQSLYFSQKPNNPVEWLRPTQITDDPQFFVEGFSRFDIQQGQLGDCWLMAAIANLTMYPSLFFQVVPHDQAFCDNYVGIFHFRFWQYGRWIDIVIDDRLPTRYGQLLFLRSSAKNEFWGALLEKAYAKLHGSYEALKGGSTCEAMEDFTGGVTEMYELNTAPEDLYEIMLKAFERGSLMGCSINADPNELEACTDDGLVRGHAYSITKVKFVEIHTENTTDKIPLLRLRNPWGDDTEWNGAWSDSSPEWRSIREEETSTLGLNFDSDGEFWMSYKDFVNKFDHIELCNLNPNSLNQSTTVKKWEVSYYEGAWVQGVTAGGCRNFMDTFANNPQYHITLTETDEEENDGKCTVIVALMQKNRRSKRQMGLEELFIGFVLYYIHDPNSAPRPLDCNFFKLNVVMARSGSYTNSREVTCRIRLSPGTYAIIPSTFNPEEDGEFLLRVFSEHQNHMEEHDAPIEIKTQLVDAPNSDVLWTRFHMDEAFDTLAGSTEEIDWKQLQKLLKVALKRVAANTSVPEDGACSLVNLVRKCFCMTGCKDNQLANEAKQEKQPLMQHQPTHAGNTANLGFGDDVCRSMVAMYDDDYSGKMGIHEFKLLWTDISNWINIFNNYDHDKSNTLCGFELREALANVGYSVNNHTLNLLMIRYGTDGTLDLDYFIMCIVKLNHMIKTFMNHDPDNAGTAQFDLDKWLNVTIYS